MCAGEHGHNVAEAGRIDKGTRPPFSSKGGKDRETAEEMRKRIMEEETSAWAAEQAHNAAEVLMRQEIRQAVRQKTMPGMEVHLPSSLVPQTDQRQVSSVGSSSEKMREIMQVQKMVDVCEKMEALRLKIARLEGMQRVKQKVSREGELEVARCELRRLQFELNLMM